MRELKLLFPRSEMTTEINKTGTWRFMRPVYEEKTAPCGAACPAGEDIARIEMLASKRRYREAWETILLENPLPSVCGRVCFHTCEASCNRAEFDDPLAIHHIERFIGDNALAENHAPPDMSPPNGRKMAIIGSGPAGLAAAWFLRRLGYACDIFESEDEPGGLLRWGIPAYRLQEDILKREISRIVDRAGIRLECGQKIVGENMKKLRGEYDAVFLGYGHGKSIRLGVPGDEMAEDALRFLSDIRKGKPAGVKTTTAVIGGGNTAVDTARSLARLGSKPVVVYRRRRADMPAFGHEVEAALAEGVELRELVAPDRIEKNGDTYVLRLRKTKPVKSESGGRARVVPVEGETERMEVGRVYAAIGAEPGENRLTPPEKRDGILGLSHCVIAGEDVPLVYGGDLTNQMKSVADAIASGKQAAIALDIFFKDGWDAIEEKTDACRVGSGPSLSMEIYAGGARGKRNSRHVAFPDLNRDHFLFTPKTEPAALSANERVESFAEIESRFTKSQVEKESARCFNCGICNDCDNCRLFCPEMSVIFETVSRRIELDYCKGCGICVEECPRCAMSLMEEA